MNAVLFLSVMNGSAWGGSEELWFQSALWLAKNKYKVGVCCFNWPGKKDKLQQLSDVGCEFYLLPGKKETKTIWGKWKLNRILKAVPFKDYEKIIVNQGGWKDLVYAPFADLYKKLPSYTITYHNYESNFILSGQKRASLNNWVNNASENVAASGSVFKVLKEEYLIDVPRQQILINPITFEVSDSATPAIFNSDNKIIFTMLAALDTERKAQNILIKTLSGDKWKNRNWELHLYGEGKDRKMLEELITLKQMGSKIFLKGYTTKVKQVLTESVIVLQITHKDAMPISVMEAMAVGRPLLVSSVGDMPVWIKNGENGWVVNAVSEQSIDTALEKVWNEKDKWNEMGQHSFKIFQKKYPDDPIRYFLQQSAIIKE
jgi:glycosyltransferase involved in cell wall biosynthesis